MARKTGVQKLKRIAIVHARMQVEASSKSKNKFDISDTSDTPGYLEAWDTYTLGWLFVVNKPLRGLSNPMVVQVPRFIM